ncbi:MAG: flippase-like domain-containing protein [Gemmatimonadetes bacterium]|nr:flippase-like domain-containing protein [Gemmatimonadota bacterium]
MAPSRRSRAGGRPPVVALPQRRPRRSVAPHPRRRRTPPPHLRRHRHGGIRGAGAPLEVFPGPRSAPQPLRLPLRGRRGGVHGQQPPPLRPRGRTGPGLRLQPHGAGRLHGRAGHPGRERLLDGEVIFALIFVAILGPDFPAETLPERLADGMRIAAAGLGVVLTGTVLVVAFPARCLAMGARLVALLPSGRLSTGLTQVMEGVVGGLSSMRGWRLMLPALAWTFGVWLLQSLSFWAGFLAFDIRLPFAAAMLTNGAVAMAAALPATPGYVGTLQGAVSLALVGVYGVAPEPVLACAVAWHAVNFPPITVLGLWHARRLGISLKDFRGRGSEPGNPAHEPTSTPPETAAAPPKTANPAPDGSP